MSNLNTTDKQGMFVLEDGRNVAFTFVLVSSLFLLWGFCNGMIDVMDKHFQEELKLSLSQSAWVQFAHWMGYFLMSIPAGWLATRLGYKGGIIAGLLLVAVGGFWFIPASKIAAFWAFPSRCVRRCLRPDVPGDGSQPLYHGPRPPPYAAARINRLSRVTAWDGYLDRSRVPCFFTARTPPARAPAHRRSGYLTRAWRLPFSFCRSSSSSPGPRRQGRGRLQDGRQGQRTTRSQCGT